MARGIKFDLQTLAIIIKAMKAPSYGAFIVKKFIMLFSQAMDGRIINPSASGDHLELELEVLVRTVEVQVVDSSVHKGGLTGFTVGC